LQASRAAADAFVVYKRDWLLNVPTLAPYGTVHLDRIARTIGATPYCVLLEPELDSQMNESRRLQVVNFLAERGVQDAAGRVRVAYPEAEGLSVGEVEQVGWRQLLGGNR
jgi:hypothetical protein